MKSIAFVLSLLLVPSCAIPSAISSPVNLDGIWKGVYDRGIDGAPPLHITFNFISDGETLTGFVQGSFSPTSPGEVTPLKYIKIKDNNISFTAPLAQKMDQPKMTYKFKSKAAYKFKGKIYGDEIKMTYKMKAFGNSLSPISSRGDRLIEQMSEKQGEILRERYRSELLESTFYTMDNSTLTSGEFTIIRVK